MCCGQHNSAEQRGCAGIELNNVAESAQIDAQVFHLGVLAEILCRGIFPARIRFLI